MSDVEVSFSIANSPEFDQPSDESGHGLTVEFDSGRLAKISVSVSSVSDRQAAIVVAKQKLDPLLALIQFGTGKLPRLGSPSTSLDGGAFLALPEISMKGEVTQRVPFPPLSLFRSLRGERVRQIGWYSSGMKSEWVVERIRNFYEVLELEEGLTKCMYKAPDNLRFLRHAASHPHLDNRKKAAAWLRGKIGTDHIDPLNLQHLEFLNAETPALESEARRILQTCCKWW